MHNVINLAFYVFIFFVSHIGKYAYIVWDRNFAPIAKKRKCHVHFSDISTKPHDWP